MKIHLQNSMKLTHYFGVPGCGKTTLMRNKLNALEANERGENVQEGLVRYHKFEKQKTIVLGVYDDSTFAGSDKLSKGVGPKFRQWLLDNEEKYKEWDILSEGERFSNNPTLDAMFATGNMTLVLVQVSDEELEKRRAARNNTQNETWMKGMQTRMTNLAQKYPHTIFLND
jgi:hypothetical protein